MKQAGYALQYAAVRLQADNEVVLVAVKQNGDALQYAADGLQVNNGLMLAAVESQNH